ncbi:MAG: universal stress protein [Bradymonadaceae bacterium]
MKTISIPTRAPGDFVIAHATDLHPDGGVAFAHSVALARDTGARLVSLHANPRGEVRPMPDAATLLMTWSSDSPQIEHIKIVHECCDAPIDTLLDALGQIDADLLIVGTHQWTGLGRALHESVAESVAAQVNIPLLVLPIGKKGFIDHEGRLGLRRILIPAGDFFESTIAVQTLTTLLDRLELSDIDIHLLRVGDDEVLDSVQTTERDGWRWHKEYREGKVVDEIVAACEDLASDLVVMTSRGQDGILDIFRGSQTQRAIRAMSRPILVVPLHP